MGVYLHDTSSSSVGGTAAENGLDVFIFHSEHGLLPSLQIFKAAAMIVFSHNVQFLAACYARVDYDAGRMYYGTCPCAKGLTCHGSKLFEVPYGETGMSHVNMIIVVVVMVKVNVR